MASYSFVQAKNFSYYFELMWVEFRRSDVGQLSLQCKSMVFFCSGGGGGSGGGGVCVCVC